MAARKQTTEDVAETPEVETPAVAEPVKPRGAAMSFGEAASVYTAKLADVAAAIVAAEESLATLHGVAYQFVPKHPASTMWVSRTRAAAIGMVEAAKHAGASAATLASHLAENEA